MTTIPIEGGVTQLENFLYEYKWNDNDGIHTVIFSSATRPRIGDDIVDGVLVPLVGYKINDDHSRWIPFNEDDWPDDVPTTTMKT